MVNAQTYNPIDLPYSYGFETDDLDGWTVINAGEGNNWGRSQASSETPDPSEGTYYMMYYFHENAANSYLFTRGLNLNAGENINLQFDYMGIDAWFPEKMEVLIGNAATVEAQTTQLWIDEEIGNYPYETASVNFTVPTNGVYYIAFRAFSDPDQFYLSLDNVKISTEELGVTSLSKSQLKFYPNPAKNLLTVELDEVMTNLTIYDLSGKKVLQKEAYAKKVNLDISSLPKGNYLLRAGNDKKAKTIKFIKD